MADPRPLTRKELSEFLPSQRAIRAFEKLFDIIPSEVGNSSSGADLSLLGVLSGVSGGSSNSSNVFISVSADFTTYASSFINVTSQSVITLNPTPVNGEQVIVHKNTGNITDYVDITDGVGVDRLVTDQIVLSYRFSTELNQWVRGS